MGNMKMYFGSPGSGKTTLLTKLVMDERKKKDPRRVFCNVPVKGAVQLDVEKIGKVDMSNSLILLDEAGLTFGNRDWASLPKPALEFFKLHRHYHCEICLFSQQNDDADKKIRSLCDRYFYLVALGSFTLLQEYTQKVMVDDDTHQIVSGFMPRNPLFGGLSFFWRPAYYRYFDSYEAPELEKVQDKYW